MVPSESPSLSLERLECLEQQMDVVVCEATQPSEIDIEYQRPACHNFKLFRVFRHNKRLEPATPVRPMIAGSHTTDSPSSRKS